MKRLVVTGVACAEYPWRELFPWPTTRILTLAEVLSTSRSSDPRVMGKTVGDVMDAYAPEHIIAHDLGVATTTMALLDRRRDPSKLPVVLTLFNGAFSDFDVYEARHPLRIQTMTWRHLDRYLARFGASPDLALERHFRTVKKMYRHITFASIVRKYSRSRPTRPIEFGTPLRTQILEGSNDPFIPKACIDSLEILYSGSHRTIAYEGHFPYASDHALIRERVAAIETAATTDLYRNQRIIVDFSTRESQDDS